MMSFSAVFKRSGTSDSTNATTEVGSILSSATVEVDLILVNRPTNRVGNTGLLSSK